jgi:hypothetical protein
LLRNKYVMFTVLYCPNHSSSNPYFEATPIIYHLRAEPSVVFLEKLHYSSISSTCLHNVSNYKRFVKQSVWEEKLTHSANAACSILSHLPHAVANLVKKCSTVHGLRIFCTKKSTILWDVMPSTLEEIYRHFGRKYCLYFWVEQKAA